MADEFQLGNSSSGNWWDTTRPTTPSTASGAPLNSTGSFGWPTEMVDIKARSSMDSLSVSGHDEASTASAGGVLTDPNLQLMGLGLSSHQGMEWNQAMFRDEKAESSSFRSMLQEGMRINSNFQQDSGVTSKLYTASSDDSSVNDDYKQINRGFSLDHHHHHHNIINCTNESSLTTSGFQVDNNPNILQGLLLSSSSDINQPQQQSNLMSNYAYNPSSSYGINTGELMPNWTKFPQFLRGSPPKQSPPPPQPPPPPHGQLHFSNSTPFWNATAATMSDVRPGFFPSLQTQLPTASTFDDRQKNTSDARDNLSTPVKKTAGEASSKRPRNEPSSLPAFKVRKEKMGDRITALQQLVSPFGKTDTASVLSEAIEYIKFLHEQVNVLSNPYMKSGAPIQHQQSCDKSNKDQDGPKQDLRSRGLCLVPVSSTFPVTHETTVDFWTPTFGGTFR